MTVLLCTNSSCSCHQYVQYDIERAFYFVLLCDDNNTDSRDHLEREGEQATDFNTTIHIVNERKILNKKKRSLDR